MLDEATRATILRLKKRGLGTRKIAKTLGVSRGAVLGVLADGRAEVPTLERAAKPDAYRDEILALYASCKGNLVRVHEELTKDGADFSYPALTAYCRQHGIGHEPRRPVGRYVFAPGKEMQHDTSPHEASIGGRRRTFHTASLVLCYSRVIFIQCYPRFTRFECKVFLTDALTYLEGACEECMVDNTSVLRLSGTGADMVPVPEMVAFGERFGFVIRAHEVGDADRSGRVERPFHYIENNFLAGRTFADWPDLNAQAIEWCDRVNAKPRRHLHASPRELFALERTHLRPLPAYVPEVYALHHRIVDSEGYVNVQRNRYSAPYTLIARRVEVRETKDRIEIFDGPRRVAVHAKVFEPNDVRVTDPTHRPARREGVFKRASSAEEKRIAERMPEAMPYVALLKSKKRTVTRSTRWLLRMIDEYPRDAVAAAITEALRYRMHDLERLERMVLRRIARDFFVVASDDEPETNDDDR
ncbi:MAG: transposase [Sandaracinaceae bacterium]|nr:transposase [Sandaracinaceae bacterium]